jgi:rare lipoprotein A
MLIIQKKKYIAASVVALTIFITGCTPGRMNSRRSDNSTFKNNNTDEVAFQDEDFNGDSEYSPVVESNSDEDFEFGDSGGSDDSYKSSRTRYFQKGVASWYGREFHGNKTASGEAFNMHKLTAAHRTLPFGTVVKIKNFSNNKAVNVTINDRGPYKDNRIIDLSYGAAKRIGMIRSGKANVGIIILRKGSGNSAHRNSKYGVAPASDDYAEEGNVDGHYSLQAGAFYSKRNADRLKQRIEYITETGANVVFDGDMYKVRIEGITSKREVSRYKRLLMDENIPSYTIDNSEY